MAVTSRDEILQLTDFFIKKYSQRYNRPVRPISDELRERFLHYEWPGNIRELENMIKRFVILQDEQLVLRELSRPRPMPQAVRTFAPPITFDSVAPPPFQSPPAVPPDPLGAGVDPAEGDDDEELVEEPAIVGHTQDGRRLAEVAREAALAAERAVIADTLRQVHWNRRKAAQQLGVSYKTLLNKIKETGLERP